MTTPQTPVDALTDEQRYALVEQHLGLVKHRDDLVIDRKTGRYSDAARYFDLIDAARALAAIPARPLIEMCRAALAEELNAWDIDPPLHHVKEAHDACEAWLSTTPTAPAQAILYEHEDGRYAVNPDTTGDPKWHRLGPCEVFGAPAQDAQGAVSAAIELLNQIAWNNTDRPRYVATEAIDLLRPLLAALRASSPADRQPLTDTQIEKLRDATFSVNNPFCPVDSKSMRKAVRAAERAHGIVTKERT